MSRQEGGRAQVSVGGGGAGEFNVTGMWCVEVGMGEGSRAHVIYVW